MCPFISKHSVYREPRDLLAWLLAYATDERQEKNRQRPALLKFENTKKPRTENSMFCLSRSVPDQSVK